MKIKLDFDEKVMRRYFERGSSPFFSICYQHEDTTYPGSGWTDFGVIILGWWLVSAFNLVQGTQVEELTFMDGPYALKVQRRGTLLLFSAKELSSQWELSLQQFIEEVVHAAEQVIDKLERLGIDAQGQQSLKIGVERLHRLND